MIINIEELKDLILTASEQKISIAELDSNEPLFGDESRLMLDSIDALQISIAIQKRYGIRIGDSKETRRAMRSTKSLAEFLTRVGDN